MMAGIKFFLFVIVLQCPPALLLPLAQQDVASNNNQSLVLETNHIEQITPNNSKVTELIQQIDVKDIANKVISNIEHVAISDDTSTTDLLNNLNAENITVLERHNGSNESSNISSTKLINLVEEISSADVPAFRSLISDKIKKRDVSKNDSTTVAPTTPKDHNLLLKLIPDSSPIAIDLNQIPLNNLFGEAFSFIKRFKRNTPDADTTSEKSNCKTLPIDESHEVIVCNKTITNNDLNATSVTPTRKSLQDRFFDEEELYDTVELICPLSIIVKLYTHQVLNKLAKDNLHDILNQILSSFMKGEEDVITVITKEISEFPLKLKLRLQLLHGETKEFLEKISNTVDAALCSIS